MWSFAELELVLPLELQSQLALRQVLWLELKGQILHFVYNFFSLKSWEFDRIIKTCREAETETETKTQRQRDRQTDRQPDGQTDSEK